MQNAMHCAQSEFACPEGGDLLETLLPVVSHSFTNQLAGLNSIIRSDMLYIDVAIVRQSLNVAKAAPAIWTGAACELTCAAL